MKKHIPNIITLLNLICGCIAIVSAFNNNFQNVIFWVLLAALFDFFDGFVARLLHSSSNIGIQLDSLADIVSFGLAPCFALFALLGNYANIYSSNIETGNLCIQYMPYISFIIPAFSALRLAKFNIDERQTTSFLGLPTPANAMFWISYTYAIGFFKFDNIVNIWLTVILILIFSILLVVEIPMLSLKVKGFSIKNNKMQIIIVLGTISLVIIFGIMGISFGILLYILLSIINNFVYKKANC